ncbi:MAG: hypothetical protein ACTSRU_18000 [Candidatus Hodarchaeales archaeon]
MEFDQKRIEQLQKQPILESHITVSEDGKWIIHKTIITDIKPVAYVEKVIESAKE